ncbi:MAG TPA: AAA family ATPase, partial [Tepidisphaeraceae bacterium]|nr:AAA family ATPase [Tepidisphaeraceae bacterium]
MLDSKFITKVTLKNYRSIASCDVTLGALRFLVGANGSGKSNFLDSLRFISDSLNTTLDHALRKRGGIKEVRRRSAGHPTNFTIGLELSLPDGTTCAYNIRIGARQRGGFEVQREEMNLRRAGGGVRYVVAAGTVVESTLPSAYAPAAAPDRLYLVNVS